jgi:hypothetical protein
MAAWAMKNAGYAREETVEWLGITGKQGGMNNGQTKRLQADPQCGKQTENEGDPGIRAEQLGCGLEFQCNNVKNPGLSHPVPVCHGYYAGEEKAAHKGNPGRKKETR